MNQFALLHFTINKNDRIYQVVVQPGAPWEDLEAVLHEFHQEFGKIKQEQLDLAAAKALENPVVDNNTPTE